MFQQPKLVVLDLTLFGLQLQPALILNHNLLTVFYTCPLGFNHGTFQRLLASVFVTMNLFLGQNLSGSNLGKFGHKFYLIRFRKGLVGVKFTLVP